MEDWVSSKYSSGAEVTECEVNDRLELEGYW